MAPLPLRLVADDRGAAEPVGVVLRLRDAGAVLARLKPRVARYPRLRLALGGGGAVLFAAEPGPLPWADGAAYLAADGPLLVPCGFRLDVPAPWRAAVARALLDARSLRGPAALTGEGADLRLLDLSASRLLAEVDLDAVARLRA